ncbi:MAG: hypothetical protein ACOYYS_26880 [Chloroflexota bacterium]
MSKMGKTILLFAVLAVLAVTGYVLFSPATFGRIGSSQYPASP